MQSRRRREGKSCSSSNCAGSTARLVSTWCRSRPALLPKKGHTSYFNRCGACLNACIRQKRHVAEMASKRGAALRCAPVRTQRQQPMLRSLDSLARITRSLRARARQFEARSLDSRRSGARLSPWCGQSAQPRFLGLSVSWLFCRVACVSRHAPIRVMVLNPSILNRGTFS